MHPLLIFNFLEPSEKLREITRYLNLYTTHFAANPKLGGKPHFNGATCRLES